MSDTDLCTHDVFAIALTPEQAEALADQKVQLEACCVQCGLREIRDVWFNSEARAMDFIDPLVLRTADGFRGTPAQEFYRRAYRYAQLSKLDKSNSSD